jgi:hypothetical protein
MLLNDIYYEAGEMEARSQRGSSWASLHDSGMDAKRRGPRRLVGHALIGLGRLIAAEPAPQASPLNLSRQG